MIDQHTIEYIAPAGILPRERAWEKISPKDLEHASNLIRRVGVPLPPLIDSDNRVVSGEVWVQACKHIRLNSMPVVRAANLSNEELRLYAAAAAQIMSRTTFDEALLGEELRELEQLLDFPDFSALGFDPAVLDRLLRLTEPPADEDVVPPVAAGPPISKPGDLWQLGRHRLMCGSALEASSYRLLMGGELSRFTLSDPPYNLPADAISGGGRFKHSNFIMANGELSPGEFTRFLTSAMRHISEHSLDGSLHAFFMSQHYLLELLRAGSIVFGRSKALCT